MPSPGTSPTQLAGSGRPAPLAGPAVAVVERLGVASAMLKPLRLEILGRLSEPTSATGLSRVLGMPRQRLNYHLRELEKAGLVRCVAERRRGNCTERLYQASASHYLIGPEALGEMAPPEPGPDRGRRADRFSWAYLVALVGKALRRLAVLRRQADGAGQRLLTAGLETGVRFRSPAAFTEFNERLAASIAGLVADYHDPEGRSYDVLVGCYPTLEKEGERR